MGISAPTLMETSHRQFISPTHKRTEGRAPVWGSEFTSKDAELQGGSRRNRCWAALKIARSGGGAWWCLVGSYPLFYTEFKSRDSEIKSRRGAGPFAGHSQLLVCASVLRSLPPTAPPASPLPPPLPPPAACSDVSYVLQHSFFF